MGSPVFLWGTSNSKMRKDRMHVYVREWVTFQYITLGSAPLQDILYLRKVVDKINMVLFDRHATGKSDLMFNC